MNDRPWRCLLPILALAATLPLAAAPPATFLTPPQAGAPADLAAAYVESHAADFGLTGGDVSDMEITDLYQSRHTGVTHVYFRQRLGGIPVFNGLINVNVARDGVIVSVGNRFVPDLAGAAGVQAPSISPEAAVVGAADHLGMAATEGNLVRLQTLGGPTQGSRFEGGRLSRDEIPVQLMWERAGDGSIRLAWQLVIRDPRNTDWWDLRVDATSGRVIAKNNWTQHGTEGAGATDASYLAIPVPAESPDDNGGAQSAVLDPADPTASPFGWHDDDGLAGNEYTDTRGNNVWAQEDLDNNDVGGFRPDGDNSPGTPPIDFAFVWDPNLDPEAGTNLEASIVNLFYYNNVMHDITYQYGFDEAAGNFQENNYGNGGSGSDPVNADALDGSGTNNANFGTPPDGLNPRMQMFRWVAPPGVTINAPGAIAGDYGAGGASFGAPYTDVGVTGDVVYAEDGAASGSITDGCDAITSDVTGKIGMVDRGNCEFGLKVLNLENAGAIAGIVVNDQQLPNGTINMGAGTSGGSVTITAAMLGNADGQAVKDELAGLATVNLTIAKSAADRDSDLDNGIIAHEYGHGISNRLIGGPGSTGCLFGDEQMGEGLSDFWTLLLAPRANDAPSMARGIGTYSGFGSGIRNFPYTIDLAVNPQTYADIAGTNVPHGVGEIWMAMLWEVYWELEARYGFDPDLYGGSGGNNLLIQLVVDGMKLAPCGPTFVTLRDAILTADDILTGDGSAGSGANQCEIWRGFAKRGLGELASTASTAVGNEVEDFTVPAACSTATNYIFDDGFESGDTTAWSSATP